MGMPSRQTNNFPESGRGLGHVTPTIFGITVGYPSDSLASCQTVCSRNNASVEWSYFAQKCIKFHPQPSRCKKFSRVETPRPLLTEAGNWRDRRIKGSRPLKEREGRKGRQSERNTGGERRGGMASGRGGSCSKVLGRIDATVN